MLNLSTSKANLTVSGSVLLIKINLSVNQNWKQKIKEKLCSMHLFALEHITTLWNTNIEYNDFLHHKWSTNSRFWSLIMQPCHPPFLQSITKAFHCLMEGWVARMQWLMSNSGQSDLYSKMVQQTTRRTLLPQMVCSIGTLHSFLSTFLMEHCSSLAPSFHYLLPITSLFSSITALCNQSLSMSRQAVWKHRQVQHQT